MRCLQTPIRGTYMAISVPRHFQGRAARVRDRRPRRRWRRGGRERLAVLGRASREARLRGPRRGTAGGSQVLASYAKEPHLADKTATDGPFLTRSIPTTSMSRRTATVAGQVERPGPAPVRPGRAPQTCASTRRRIASRVPITSESAASPCAVERNRVRRDPSPSGSTCIQP